MPGFSCQLLDPLWDPLAGFFPSEDEEDDDGDDGDDRHADDMPIRKGSVSRHRRERERLERRRDNEKNEDEDERSGGVDIDNSSTWLSEYDEDDDDDDMARDSIARRIDLAIGEGVTERRIDRAIAAVRVTKAAQSAAEEAARTAAAAKAEASVAAADRKAEAEEEAKKNPRKKLAQTQSFAYEDNTNTADDVFPFDIAAATSALIVEESPDSVPAILLPTRTRTRCGTEAIFIDKKKNPRSSENKPIPVVAICDEEDDGSDDCKKDHLGKDVVDDDTARTSLDVTQHSSVVSEETTEKVTTVAVAASSKYKSPAVVVEDDEEEEEDYNHIVLLQAAETESDVDGGIEAHHIFTEKNCDSSGKEVPALDSVGSF